MPVENPIPYFLKPRVAEPRRDQVELAEPFLFEVSMMPDRSQPIPLNQAAEQDITEALRKQPTVRIKDLPAQKPVPQRENQPMLPNQGESTRFTHKDTGVTIVAFGHDATRLKAENSHLLQASNKP